MATNDKTIALEMEPFVHCVERRMQDIDCDVERARMRQGGSRLVNGIYPATADIHALPLRPGTPHRRIAL